MQHHTCTLTQSTARRMLRQRLHFAEPSAAPLQWISPPCGWSGSSRSGASRGKDTAPNRQASRSWILCCTHTHEVWIHTFGFIKVKKCRRSGEFLFPSSSLESTHLTPPPPKKKNSGQSFLYSDISNAADRNSSEKQREEKKERNKSRFTSSGSCSFRCTLQQLAARMFHPCRHSQYSAKIVDGGKKGGEKNPKLFFGGEFGGSFRRQLQRKNEHHRAIMHYQFPPPTPTPLPPPEKKNDNRGRTKKKSIALTLQFHAKNQHEILISKSTPELRNTRSNPPPPSHLVTFSPARECLWWNDSQETKNSDRVRKKNSFSYIRGTREISALHSHLQHKHT